MRSSIAQLIIGTAVAMSVVGVSASGSAVAQSPVGQAQVIGQEALTNRYGSPFSETDFRLVIVSSSGAIFLMERASDSGDSRTRTVKSRLLRVEFLAGRNTTTSKAGWIAPQSPPKNRA